MIPDPRQFRIRLASSKLRGIALSAAVLGFAALALGLVIWLPLLTHAQQNARKTLDVYVIDVEGGNATLFVSPNGESLHSRRRSEGKRRRLRFRRLENRYRPRSFSALP